MGTAVNDNSYQFYLASAANAEVLICKASSDWLKLCLLLSFCYLKLQYKLLSWNLGMKWCELTILAGASSLSDVSNVIYSIKLFPSSTKTAISVPGFNAPKIYPFQKLFGY